MKDMGYRRLGDFRVDGSEGKFKARCPNSESQIKGHEGIDFPTFLDQIMSSVMAGKEGGCE